MGIYLNPGNIDFKRALNSDIYVDKSRLIEYTNKKYVQSNSLFALADRGVLESQWLQIC